MKNDVILNHYKDLIENYMFDEYDILGFLIFIREKIDTSRCHFINEFCNLIAHRTRNEGKIKNNILNASKNSYACNKKRKIKGYNGIKWETWIKEWKIVGEQFKINFMKDNKKVLKEITICIISLAQDTEYFDNDVLIGKVEPFIDSAKKIALLTSENQEHSPLVCLMTCGPFKEIANEDKGFINNPLETKRINKALCLYCGDKLILTIK